jgi:6-phosphogluconate dehydrogenase
MELGMIGLGRMGGNMARRLVKHGHTVVGNARSRSSVDAVVVDGVVGAYSLEELTQKLHPPRAVWLMMPAASVDSTIDGLVPLLTRDDIIVDGGDSYYRDDTRRALRLASARIHYLDVGTSGGVWGLERGYCLMIGGDADAVQRLDPIFSALAPGPGSIARTPGREAPPSAAECGYLHCGPTGAGHFVKMVENGVEYGLMGAYAEGLNILRHAENFHYEQDLRDIAEVWRRGSVVASWLLDLTAAIDESLPASVPSLAVPERFTARSDGDFADALPSAMHLRGRRSGG